MSEQGWTRVFIAAAIFNLAVGLPLLLDPAMGPKLLPLPAGDFIWPRLAGGLIVVLGSAISPSRAISTAIAVP